MVGIDAFTVSIILGPINIVGSVISVAVIDKVCFNSGDINVGWWFRQLQIYCNINGGNVE